MIDRSPRRQAVVIIVLTSFLLTDLVWSVEGAGKGIGIVVNLSGDWFLDGNPPVRIKEGDDLPAGGKIWPSSTTPAAKDVFMEVLLRNGMTWRSHCDAKPCSRREPLTLPGAIEKEASWWETLQKFLRIRARDEYIQTHTRGDDPEEGIAILSHGKINLRDVFGRMTPDVYCLRFQSLDANGKPRNGSTPQKVIYDWEPGQPQPLSVAGLDPGLYEIELLDRETSNLFPTGRTAWVLIARPQDHQRLRESFQNAVELTKKWDPEVSPRTVRVFLRAYLNALALGKIK